MEMDMSNNEIFIGESDYKMEKVDMRKSIQPQTKFDKKIDLLAYVASLTYNDWVSGNQQPFEYVKKESQNLFEPEKYLVQPPIKISRKQAPLTKPPKRNHVDRRSVKGSLFQAEKYSFSRNQKQLKLNSHECTGNTCVTSPANFFKTENASPPTDHRNQKQHHNLKRVLRNTYEIFEVDGTSFAEGKSKKLSQKRKSSNQLDTYKSKKCKLQYQLSMNEEGTWPDRQNMQRLCKVAENSLMEFNLSRTVRLIEDPDAY